MTGATVAGPFENGFEAYERGDYSEAMTRCRRAADKGDANAVFLIGVMHFEGRGIPKDCSEAAKWFHHAAEMGDVDAQLSLGLQYLKARVCRGTTCWRICGSTSRPRMAGWKAGRDIASLAMSRDQLAEAHRLTRDWKPSPK